MNRAARAGVVLVLLTVLSCASTGTVSDRAFFYEGRSVVWQAALRAMRDVGARIVSSSEPAGILTGALDLVELGGRVRLDVRVSSSPGGTEAESTGTDLDVSVTLEGRPNDDLELREDLAEVRDAYIDAARRHAASMGGRYRR